MPAAPVALTYVTFGSNPIADDCKDALLRQGHALKPIPAHRLAANPTMDSDECLILFVDGCSGQQIPFRRITKAVARSPTLVIIGATSTDGLDELLENADEFCRWPCPLDQIEIRLRRLVGRSAKAAIIRTDLGSTESDPIQRLIGKSAGFVESMKHIYKVAPYDSPVLITGETGTGKELTARAIHYLSPRQDEPFLPVNCAAIPDSIIESELFGHEAGAYTDAKTRRKGLFEQANRGTLFLDEVDSLSLTKGQVILLRIVEDQLVRPVGSDSHSKLNVRIIAATNCDIHELIEQGKFRKDLFYRLNILAVQLTALRERDADIELLSKHFLSTFSAQYGFQKHLSDRGLQSLLGYEWPGNVRELENFLRREYLLRDGDVLDCASLESRGRQPVELPMPCARIDESFREAKQKLIMQFERRYLIEIIKRSRGNVSEAARLAGKERRSMGRLVKKYGIDVTEYRQR